MRHENPAVFSYQHCRAGFGRAPARAVQDGTAGLAARARARANQRADRDQPTCTIRHAGNNPGGVTSYPCPGCVLRHARGIRCRRDGLRRWRRCHGSFRTLGIAASASVPREPHVALNPGSPPAGVDPSEQCGCGPGAGAGPRAGAGAAIATAARGTIRLRVAPRRPARSPTPIVGADPYRKRLEQP